MNLHIILFGGGVEMFDRLRAKLVCQKLHYFDLENPKLYLIGNYEVSVYTCKKCGKPLELDPWQMKDLPWEMKIGCK